MLATDEDTYVTQEQKDLIRASFSKLAPEGDRVASRFYARLFEIEPSLRPMFLGGLRFQKVKFIDMLASALESMEHLDNVVAVVWQLGKRHAGYGVKDAHYDIVRAALLHALSEEIGTSNSDATIEAWGELFDLMASAMKQAGAEGMIPRP